MIDATTLDPATVAAWLGHGLPPTLIKRLTSTQRFAPRVAELLEARLGDLPRAMEAAQVTALELDMLGMAGLALRAGAVWYGQQIARMIDGAAVRALVSVIGPDLRSLALLHRELSPETDPLDVDELASALERQGVACLRAWSQRQPKSIALRMELRLPQGLSPSDAHLYAGPVIVETLLWRIGA